MWKPYCPQPLHAPPRATGNISMCHHQNSFRPNNHQKWCLCPKLVDLCILSLFYPWTHCHMLLRHLLKFLRTSTRREDLVTRRTCQHHLPCISYFLRVCPSHATLCVKFMCYSSVKNQFITGSPILSVQPEQAGFKPVQSIGFEDSNQPNPPSA
jgi:hypothetical protein